MADGERDTRDDVARLDLLARLDRQNGLDRQQVTGIAATGHLDGLALGVLDDDRGLQLGAARRRAPIDDDAVGGALDLVRLLAHGRAVDQILELDLARGLGEDRTRVGVPLRQLGAALDLVTFVDVHAGAVLHLVGRQLLARLIDDDDRHGAAHRDEPALAVLHDGAVLDLHLAVEVRSR